MRWSGTRIRELAEHGPVIVTLADGRTCLVRRPEEVGGPPGLPIGLPVGRDALALVDPDQVVDEAPCEPDPDVEEVRAGHPPDWMLRRLVEQPEVFVKAARLDPAALGRALAGLEPGVCA